jgi:hypothetical protein
MRRTLVVLVVLAGCKDLVGIQPYTSVDAASSDADGDGGGSGCACAFGCERDPCTTTVVAGYHQTCALVAGQVYCWGQNNGGPTQVSAIPELVPGLAGINVLSTSSTPDTQGSTGFAPTQDSSGPGLACSADQDNVWCWGDNNFGEVGLPAPVVEATPEPVLDTSSATLLAAGGDHGCALIGPAATPTVVCWGADSLGQLGDGSDTHGTSCNGANSCEPIPVHVQIPGDTVTQLGAGRSHTCALVGTGTGYVYCWGAGGAGQIGDELDEDQKSPVLVYNATGTSGSMLQATAIAVGGDHACALMAGHVVCWGLNASGELGNGTTDSMSYPVNVLMLADATAIAAGEADTCAIAMGGEVWCWGANLVGTLGNTVANQSPTPVQVFGITDAIAITVGAGHACAVHATGAISCWGSNDDGELGDGITLHSGVPPCAGDNDCSFKPVTVAMPGT